MSGGRSRAVRFTVVVVVLVCTHDTTMASPTSRSRPRLQCACKPPQQPWWQDADGLWPHLNKSWGRTGNFHPDRHRLRHKSSHNGSIRCQTASRCNWNLKDISDCNFPKTLRRCQCCDDLNSPFVERVHWTRSSCKPSALRAGTKRARIGEVRGCPPHPHTPTPISVSKTTIVWKRNKKLAGGVSGEGGRVTRLCLPGAADVVAAASVVVAAIAKQEGAQTRNVSEQGRDRANAETPTKHFKNYQPRPGQRKTGYMEGRLRLRNVWMARPPFAGLGS